MNTKTKAILIIGTIIAFFFGWVVFVMSLLGRQQNTTDIIRSGTKIQQLTGKNITNTGNNNAVKTISKTTIKNNIKKEKHSFTLLTPSNLNNKKDWSLFNKLYKNITDGNINVKYYDDINEYKEKLVYLLATHSDSFDFAIIPSEWYQNIEYIANKEFEISGISFPITSIFDYNFNNYLKNNTIKAIPYGIDPIIGYSLKKYKNISEKQTISSWKEIIIQDSNRLNGNRTIQTMPVFLGYDKIYLKYIEKTNKSFFPIFDYILNYYVFKKNQKLIELVKSFGKSGIYNTFNFTLYRKLYTKYRKNNFCKNHMKYCLLFTKRSKLVYGFASEYNILYNNRVNIFKTFKIKPSDIKFTTLPLGDITNEYPARGWIIIINPNSKNLQYLKLFFQTYIKLGKKNMLPFYKNIVSPFLIETRIRNKNLYFLKNYLGRFITFEKMGMNITKTISKKIQNFLQGKINITILLK